INFTGTITPALSSGYRLGGGGSLTLANTNALSGTNNVTITNGGAVVLAAANNYVGTTNINNGILNAATDASLGNAANPISFGGGTLQFGSSFNTARTITLNAGGGGIDTNGFVTTLSQNL